VDCCSDVVGISLETWYSLGRRGSGGGNGVAKKKRHTAAMKPLLNCMWRVDRLPLPGHAFVEFTDPDLKSNKIRDRLWKGFAARNPNLAPLDVEIAGEVRNEPRGPRRTGERGHHYNRYYIERITWDDLHWLLERIEHCATRPPRYKLTPDKVSRHGPGTPINDNCVTWIRSMFMYRIHRCEIVSGGSKDYDPWIWMPRDLDKYAESVNQTRTDLPR